uniref:Zinc finger GRF-type domain-containing protein n=1 Tax=Oryza punctata TaxID=4537 RepID=A0A0E0L195_ORYPU
MCRCKVKVVRWISWSVDNLGHRYFKCRNTQIGGLTARVFGAHDGGCDFFAWHDGLTSSFLREVLNDLRGVVHSLRREKAKSVKEIEEVRAKTKEQSKEVDSVRKKLASVLELASALDVKMLFLMIGSVG